MIDTKTYWNNRYHGGGNSGYGSYGEQAQRKLAAIAEYVKNIHSITDIGCGDFGFGKEVVALFTKQTPLEYKGYDISDVIIAKNQKQYPAFFFATNPKIYPPADLVLCIDVLFHFGTKEEQEVLLLKMEQAWTKYLVISAADQKNDVSRFGEPVAKILLEQEDDSSYLYIWKK